MEIICIPDGRINYGMKEFVAQEFNISLICHICTTRRFHFDGEWGVKKLTLCSTVLSEKPTVSELIKKFPTFTETEVLLSCSLVAAVGIYIQPVLYDPFRHYPSIYEYLHQVASSISFAFYS
jgi:hypothetical protein